MVGDDQDLQAWGTDDRTVMKIRDFDFSRPSFIIPSTALVSRLSVEVLALPSSLIQTSAPATRMHLRRSQAVFRDDYRLRHLVFHPPHYEETWTAAAHS